MRFPNETFRSLGVAPHAQERQVLDVLGTGLRRLYGEPLQAPLPDRLQELVAKLEANSRRRQVGREHEFLS
jgi:hypothetical protein